MNKRPRTSIDNAVVDVWQREVGRLSGRNFAHRLLGSEDLVLRLDLHRKHRGCVNTVDFNGDGDIMVSGSDDRRHTKLSFHSGHVNNVFQAKLMPHSDDRSIVTCAADGQFDLGTGAATELLLASQLMIEGVTCQASN